MLNLLLDYITIGVVQTDNLERTKNFVSYTAAKTCYEYLQKYGTEPPYEVKYSKAIVFVVLVVIWPLTIPIFFRDAKDPNEDFSKS